MNTYVPLHVHDGWSVLDGASKESEYMARAKELGFTHLSQTNHGTLSGWRSFQRAAKEAGIIPILGMEGYFTEDRFDKTSKTKRQDGDDVYQHLIVLAKDDIGHRNIHRASEAAWTEGYYFKPRMDWDVLEDTRDGVIVTSACMSGPVAMEIRRGNMDKAMQVALRFKGIYGDDFYIEVMSSNEADLNKALLEIADKAKIKPIMSSDCHFAAPDQKWLEEAMLILSTAPKANFSADLDKAKKMEIFERFDYLYPDRTMNFTEFDLFLKDYADEHERFKKQGIDRTDIFANTIEIANKVGEYPYYAGIDLLPRPKGGDPDEILRKKAYAGLKKRGMHEDPEAIKRLEHELGVIIPKGFASYFIIVEDFINWAKSRQIMVGPGRGSGASSLVAYALGITDVDPLEYGLLFFRFLDPDRDDYPDFDIDIQDSRRQEVKEYLIQKYGDVANIATYSLFGGKSAVKAAGRVYRVPVSEVNASTKDNDAPAGEDYYDFFQKSEVSKAFARKHPEVVQLARELDGRIQSSGMHASGVVIGNQPLSNYAPIETAKDPRNPNGPRVSMVAVDMSDAADIGLIKFDLLGLKNLSVIRDCLESVAARTGRKINMLDVSLDDDKVYKLISSGYTKGIFQVEASAYTNLVMDMGGVSNFAELTATNALIRPGAMKTIGPSYIARKNGEEMVEYIHSDMKWFTEETYGLPTLYQEQVMLLMTELGGMSMSDANKVRSIMAKKKDKELMQAYKSQFIDGASQKIKESKAEQLWKDIEAQAEYSFNKAHSVAYSMISYWTAWLKHYYPTEFMYASLRNEKDSDVITEYLIEAKRLGVTVRLPHINKSREHVSIESDGAIRLGLTNIKYVGESAAIKVLKGVPYSNYTELTERAAAKGSGISKRILDCMNAVGAAAFEDNPLVGNERDNLYEYLKIPNFAATTVPHVVKTKLRPIEDYDAKGVFPIMGIVRKVDRKTGWARVDVLDESGSKGIFAAQDIPLESGQMYCILVADNRVARYVTAQELSDKINTPWINYLYDDIPELQEDEYFVVSLRSRRTKAGKKMGDMVALDHTGKMFSALVWPSSWDAVRVKFREGVKAKIKFKETEEGAFFVDDGGKRW